MGLSPATYRCRKAAPLLGLLECDRAAANTRMNAAAREFLQTQSVLHRTQPICYSVNTQIGSGPVKDFFRALIAQWMVEHSDIPYPVSEQAIEIARGARAESYFNLLEKQWRLVLALTSKWQEPALPMSVGCAIGIVTALACNDYSFGYIRNTRTTIRFAHHFSHLPVPTEDERFEVFFDCVARRLGDSCPNAKDALMLDQLRHIGELIYAGTSSHEIQEWALLTLTFFSVFRRTNVTEIENSDVTPFNDGFRISLRKSKTDQHSKGHEVFIDPISELPELCPVRAIARWKEQLAGSAGPFFRHLGPLGIVTDEPLNPTTLGDIVKRMIGRIGGDPARYSAQSLRAGLITEALLANIPLHSLAGHTNHKELVSLTRYFRPRAEHRMQIVRTIATGVRGGIVRDLAGV